MEKERKMERVCACVFVERGASYKLVGCRAARAENLNTSGAVIRSGNLRFTCPMRSLEKLKTDNRARRGHSCYGTILVSASRGALGSRRFLNESTPVKTNALYRVDQATRRNPRFRPARSHVLCAIGSTPRLVESE